MNPGKRILVTLMLVVLSVVLAIGVTACASDDVDTDDPAAIDGEAQEEGTDAAQEPAVEIDPERQLIETKCSMCHSTDRVWSVDYDRETWITTIDRMETNGLVLADDERQQIIDYLVTE